MAHKRLVRREKSNPDTFCLTTWGLFSLLPEDPQAPSKNEFIMNYNCKNPPHSETEKDCNGTQENFIQLGNGHPMPCFVQDDTRLFLDGNTTITHSLIAGQF